MPFITSLSVSWDGMPRSNGRKRCALGQIRPHEVADGRCFGRRTFFDPPRAGLHQA